LTPVPPTIDALQAALEGARYFAERSLATAMFLALKLERPLLLEGEPGVGKTEVAKVLSRLLDRPLVRLQCYEGLDTAQALYEWDYARQMLHIRLLEATGEGRELREQREQRKDTERELFSRQFLLERPLLQAVTMSPAPVLLIDELDRADEEFEAFLLELLSDFQVTVPEIGTFRAAERPVVVVTSNRTREIHDALRRRCLYAWIDFPDFDKELAIVRAKAPEAGDDLAAQVVSFVQQLRRRDLYKLPGIAETLDWIRALTALGETGLRPETVEATLGVLLKYQDDLEAVRASGIADVSDPGPGGGVPLEKGDRGGFFP
jgi:MoxR-like ATPase